MSPLFKKLNLADHDTIFVLNAPTALNRELESLSQVTVRRRVTAKSKITFVLAFAVTQAELDKGSTVISRSAVDDAVVWIAYPKKSSRTYQCEFNRDTGWTVLGNAGFEPVRQVAIDEDWSALRFRRVEYIKSLQRNPKMAISREGQRRTRKPHS